MLRIFDITDHSIVERDRNREDGKPLADAIWIDACDPGDDERRLLKQLLHSALPEPEDVDEIESSARYFIDDTGIHVHSLFLAESNGRHSTTTVACLLQPDRLVTVRDSRIADFHFLRVRARRGQVESHSPQDLLTDLFEQKIGKLADTLEDIHRKLEAISPLVLKNKEADLDQAISRLAQLEDSNGKVRLCLMDTQRSVLFLQRHLEDYPEVKEDCGEMIQDVNALMSHSTFLFEKINFLMNSTQGFINIRQNRIIKIFSIAAVVFLPPTLVASIYGMNFDVMPELKWLLGYPWALGLMLLSGIAPYVFFKRKGWL